MMRGLFRLLSSYHFTLFFIFAEKIKTKDKHYGKKFFPQLALAVLFAGCSDINTVYDNPITPKSGHEANIVENSQYGGYIDWQTYAGDNFCRYATGAWQDATDLGGRNVIGTQCLQNDLELEFTKNDIRRGDIMLFRVG